MPTYVYECSSCKETYEVEQRIIENSLTDCRCGSLGTLKRVIQPVGIAFKGSGFYINDSVATPATKAVESKPADSAASDATPASTDGDKSAVTPPPAEKPTTAEAPAPAPAPATQSQAQ